MAAAPSAASEAAIAGLQSHARAQFPYFQPRMGHPAFMENAGGSQVTTQSHVPRPCACHVRSWTVGSSQT